MDLMSILKQAGFKGQALKMAYAIAMAESSGNARAHNPNAGTGDNSYGLFQINMLGGMGPERRRQYGLSRNEDLFDPLTNAKVAYKMSNGGANWGPWSTYGSGAYKQFYGGSGAEVTSSGSGGTVNDPGGVVPKLSFEELAEQYGYTASMLNAIPELKKLFNQMVSEEWTKDKFQAKLRETKWWKTISSDERQWITLKYTDPATAKQKQDQALIKITQIAKQLGLTGKYGTADFLNSYAYNLVAKGWDEGRVRYELARFLNPNMKTHTGEAGAAWDEIDAYAYGMGVKLSENWIRTRAVNIVRGIGTVQDVKNEVANMAKAQFPQWSKQIDGGQTVADIAMPYMQSMSEILELNPGSINLFDPTIKSTLSWMNPQTQKKEAKPMWQFENELRGDVRWKKTKNAQDSLMQVAHQVLSDFGVKY